MKTPAIDGAATELAALRSSRRTMAAKLRLVGALIEQCRFAQVEFPFNPASRHVCQHAAAKAFVDLPTLGIDQQKFDFIVQVAELSVIVVTGAAVFDVLSRWCCRTRIG